jgi:hypothetical protein
MKKHYLFISAFCLLFLLIQCKKDSPPAPTPKKLGDVIPSNQEKNVIPYNSNDRMVFENSKGDSISYSVDSAFVSYLGRMYKGGGTEVSDYYDVYNYSLSLKDKSGKSDFIDLCPALPDYISNGHKGQMYLRIGLDYPNNINYQPTFDCYLDTTKFNSMLDGVINFHSTITIAGREFNNVYELKSTLQPNDSYEYFTSCFYSMTRGVVGFTTNKGDSWSLK